MPPFAPAHTLLIVEDDAVMAALLAECVRSLGMRSRTVTTLDAIDAAVAEEMPCGVLLDRELPAAPGSVPLASSGDTGQRRLRARDPRKTAADHHVFPILVVTNTSSEAPNVTRTLRDGASDFIPKPFDPVTLTTAILAAFERAGRADHASCAALVASAAARAPSAPAPAGADRIPLVFDGVPIGKRNGFLVCGKRRDLQDVPFATALRLGAERARGSEAYLPKRELGILSRPKIPNMIREAVEGAVPAGFSIVHSGAEGMFRLHPLVEVAPIDWTIFERHSNPAIQNIASAERKRR